MPNTVQDLERKVGVRLAALNRSPRWLAEEVGTTWDSLRRTIRSPFPSSRSLAGVADALHLDVTLFYAEGLPAELLALPEGWTSDGTSDAVATEDEVAQ